MMVLDGSLCVLGNWANHDLTHDAGRVMDREEEVFIYVH